MLAPEAPRGRALARALGLTLVVPVLSIPLRIAHVPDRVQWLAYEVALFALTLLLRTVVWSRRAEPVGASPEARRAVRALTSFELLQYGLWATSDVLILAGVEAGWLLRLVPNTLYYAAFVRFAQWCWAEGAGASARRTS